MAGFDFGSILSAGLNFFGAQETNDKNIAAQKAINDENVALSREMAQKSIQYKVSDAKAAGINPYYAVGAPTSQPATVVAPTIGQSGLSAASQDIGRAAGSLMSSDQRDKAFDEASKKLALEKGGLENQLLSAQIAKLRTGTPPAFPAGDRVLVDGQGNAKIDPKTLSKPIAFGGYKFAPIPGTSQAQEVENQYGNVAGDVFGATHLVGAGVRNYLLGVRDGWRKQGAKKYDSWRRVQDRFTGPFGTGY